MQCSDKLSRRDILKAAAAGLAVPCFVPRSVLAAPGVPGANDRIRTGVIGCGRRIQGVMRQSPKDIQLAAISDCDTRQMGVNSYFGKAEDRMKRFPEVRLTEGARVADGKLILDGQGGTLIAGPK